MKNCFVCIDFYYNFTIISLTKPKQNAVQRCFMSKVLIINKINHIIMEDKLVTLKNYETMVEALFDQDLLQKNGIQSSINNGDSVELMPMFGEINNGLQIMVLENDLEKALEALGEYENSVEE